MQKTAGRILAVMVAFSAISTMAYGVNPLKNYNLYEDTHAADSKSYDRETVMGEFYSNSLAADQAKRNGTGNSSSSKSSGSSDGSLQKLPSDAEIFANTTASMPKTRNADLRESSRRVYSNPSTPGGWVQGPSFYANPTLASIKAKYRQSNFAGCMQEASSYVRKHPNDTLGFYYLAMSYAKVNDKENAIKAYEKVIALNANPMIVKYATNGRNCVMNSSDDKCYQNVNVPELIYPYKDIAKGVDLTPVDPETLVKRNLQNVQGQFAAAAGAVKEGAESVSLPFGAQDANLDQFINAPYGNGLSPQLNSEYEAKQLKKLQETMNNDQNTIDQNLQNIKQFENHKSDAGESVKLAYVNTDELNSLTSDPAYAATKKEIKQLNMLFGNSSTDNFTDYVSTQGENLSPEVIQALMVKSMMPEFTFVNSDNKNLL